MDKVYKIFISLTSKDLIKEQKIIIQTLLEMDCFPVKIEFFQDSNELQLEQIKKVIDSCNYYIIIAAGKYDTLEHIFQKKYSRMNYALEVGVPIIRFIHKSIENLLPKKIDTSEKIEKLLEFLQYGEIEIWSNLYELVGKISISIYNTIESHKISYKKQLKVIKNKKYKSLSTKELLNNSELIFSAIREFTNIILSAGITALSSFFDVAIIATISKINFYEMCDNLNVTNSNKDKINIIFHLYNTDISSYIIINMENDFLLDFYIKFTQKYFSHISSIKSIKEYKNSMISEIGEIFSSVCATALSEITSSVIEIEEKDINYLKNKLNKFLPFYIGSLSGTFNNNQTTFNIYFIIDKKSVQTLVMYLNK